jgi:hypothetical protein
MNKVSGDYAYGRGTIIVGKPTSPDGPIRTPKPKPKPDFIGKDEFKV